MLMSESLRLARQPGLISQEERTELWKRGARRPIYYLGFLAASADNLPLQSSPLSLPSEQEEALNRLAIGGNPFARQLLRIHGSQGQGFVATCLRVMEKPANQDVVSCLLEVIRAYFKDLRPEGDPDLTLEKLTQQARSLDLDAYVSCIQVAEDQAERLQALYILSGVGYGILRPVFSKTDAIGSLMRKKLSPVFDPLRTVLQHLMA